MESSYKNCYMYPFGGEEMITFICKKCKRTCLVEKRGLCIDCLEKQHEKELEDLRMKIIKKIGFDINSLKESK